MSKQRGVFKTTFKDKYNMRECQTPLGIKFVFGSTETAWSVWQQAQKVVVPEGFVLVPKEPTEAMYSELSRHLCRYMQMKDRYCPKTLGNYLERFVGLKNIPQWLHDEVKNWESNQAFATADMGVFIYKAMIEAVDQPV